MICITFTSFVVASLLSTLTHFVPLLTANDNISTWPNANVYYQFDSEFTVGDKEQVQYAIEIIESKTCIKFYPVKEPSGNQGYISLKLSQDDCVNADICYQGGKRQVALFGPDCVKWPKVIHGLLLNLCLRHENTRSDRDEWMGYSKCGRSLPKGNWDLRGHMYDYASRQHDTCRGCPNGRGWAKKSDVHVCGEHVTKGVSVLDAEKLNDYYNCQGCNRHRWRSEPSKLSEEEKKEAFFVGDYSDEEGGIFVCRAYYEGRFIVGKYTFRRNLCHIPWYVFNKEVAMKENFQVMMVTNQKIGDYRELDVTVENFVHFVPIGRTRCGLTTYAAVAEFTDTKGNKVKSVGEVYGNDFSTALFTDDGETIEISKFKVLGCKSLNIGPILGGIGSTYVEKIGFPASILSQNVSHI